MVISLIGSYIDQSPYNRKFVAEYMKVSRNTVSNWCTGNTYPSIPQLFKLAELLDVDYGDLYVRKDC